MAAEKKGGLRLYFGCSPEVDLIGDLLREAHEAAVRGERVVCYSKKNVFPSVRRRTRTFVWVGKIDLAELQRRGTRWLVIFDAAEFFREFDAALLDECRNAGIMLCGTLYLTQLSGMQEALSDFFIHRGGVLSPDWIFDEADEIRFVEWGYHFSDTRADVARMSHLREAALHRLAERTETRNQRRAPQEKTYEHILVCLSAAPTNARVIRSAARMARELGARLTALYVELQRPMGEAARAQLRENTSFARKLGASVVNVYGEDVSLQIAEYAKIARVTKIIIGRSASRLFTGNIARRLSEYAPDAEVFIIPDEHTSLRPLSLSGFGQMHLHYTDVLFAIGVLMLCILIGFVMVRLQLSPMNILAVFMLGTVAVAWWLTQALLSLAYVFPAFWCLNYFFQIPGPGRPQIWATFIILSTAAVITGAVMERFRRLSGANAKNAYNTSVLLTAGQAMYAAETMEEIGLHAMRSIQNLLGCATVFGYLDENGTFVCRSLDAEGQPLPAIDFNDQSAAHYAFENNVISGMGTRHFRIAKGLFMPLADAEGVNAVIGMYADVDRVSRTDHALLDSLIAMITFVLEKHESDRRREQAARHAENETLRANLLRAISHDLRTPLTGILGSAGLLKTPLEESIRQELVEDIAQDAQWLVNLVENVLSITRMEDGRLEWNLTPQLVEEIAEEAIRHTGDSRIRMEIEDPLLMIRADAQLLTQVLVNLINNAFAHGGSGVEVTIRARREGDDAVIDVADNGVGIPDGSKNRVFDLFYTTGGSPGDRRKGLGLGLALCSSIVKVHGGTITISDAVPHGAVFTIRLKAMDVAHEEVIA